MAFVQTASLNVNYDENTDYWLKFYKPGETTPLFMATDSSGATTLAKARVNSSGFITTVGNSVFIPFMEESYDAFLFPTEAEADANDTVNAIMVADNINPFFDDFSTTRNNFIAVDALTVYPLTFNVSGEAVVVVDGLVLTEDVDYTITPNTTFFDLNLTVAATAGVQIQVWSRIIAPAKLPIISGSNVSLNFIADVQTSDLNGIANFQTFNYDTVGDNGGASWSFVETVISKSGVPPELATGNVFDINGRKYVHSDTVLKDRSFGIKTSNQSLNIHIDVTTELNDFIAFGRLRAAQDGVAKGGSKLFFTPRQELEKTGTLNLIDYYIKIDFYNTTIYQQDATNDVINWEGNGTGVSNLIIRYADSVTDEDLFNGKPAAFRISGGQDIEIISESVFSELQNIWVFGGWDGFKLDSQIPFGGLFWQFLMTQCYITEHMNRAYSFVSISQTSTTSKFQNCHAGCKIRDGVTNLGNSYLALQHMEVLFPINPGVTVGWESFWELETTLVPERPAWVSGVFYRTMGTGWDINNVQTTEMSMCSLDGATNEVDGNVIKTLNSVLSVQDFHLEGHNQSKADGISFLIGSDSDFGFLYMFDLRLRPGVGNRAYLFGGLLNRDRNFALQGVRNQNQAVITSGDLVYINGGNDITAFNSLSCGVGVPAHLTFNVPDETHYDRPIKLVIVTATGTVGDQVYSKGVKTVTVASASAPVYTIQREDSGALIQSDATGLFTVFIDPTVTPFGDFVRMSNRGVGSLSSSAIGGGSFTGSNTAASAKVLTVTKVSATLFLGDVSA